MAKFPVDAPRARVVRALQSLGFQLVRKGEHISMVRANPDGTKTPLTMPNHARLKASTLADHLHAIRDFARRISCGVPEVVGQRRDVQGVAREFLLTLR